MSKGIDAKELRIGNYLTDLFGETFEVDGIETYGVFNSKIGDIPLDGCVSIPLTEEWLLKLGFKQMDSSGHYNYTQYKSRDWRFYVFKPNDYEGYLLVDGMVTITDRIKHVHQLQNLYYALTGEELTLKPEDNE